MVVERLVYQWIEAELFKARSKFPSSNQSVLATFEEAGELCKAVLDRQQGKATLEDIRNEAIQVAATALRVIIEGDPSLDIPKLTDLNDEAQET